MIIYLTKQTKERYALNYAAEMNSPLHKTAMEVFSKEQGNGLLEWGAKLFYFDRKKCIQVMNFASNFTMILIDVKKAQIQNLGSYMANDIMSIYKDDKPMMNALEKMFSQFPLCIFDKLSDKTVISTLNYTQQVFLEDGYRLYDYIKDGVLNTLDINKELNYSWLLTQKKIKETGEFVSGKLFRKYVIEKYGE